MLCLIEVKEVVGRFHGGMGCFILMRKLGIICNKGVLNMCKLII